MKKENNMNLIKQKFNLHEGKLKEILIIILKNLILMSIIFILYQILFIKGKPLNAYDFTNIGINTIYSEEFGDLKIKPEKIILITGIIVTMYFSTFAITNNLYQGFKEIIRNNSENFLEYLKYVYKLYIRSVMLDVIFFIVDLIIVLNIVHAENIYNYLVLMNIIKMLIFYISLPILLVMITNRIEIFIGGILVLSMLSTLFIYQLNGWISLIVGIIIYIITYLGLLYKERFN